MKKLVIIAASVLTLAICSVATYAWFTNSSETTSLQVNAAKIEVDILTKEVGLEVILPGEVFTFDELDFDNLSSRESVVEFSISAVDIRGWDENDDLSEERKELLLKELNNPDNIKMDGVKAGNNKSYRDPDSGNVYIWLDGGQNLDGTFSISMEMPKELGGNYPYGENSIDYQNEHNAIVSCNIKAFAVQGTSAAVEDIFGTAIADEFEDHYK